MQTHPSRNLYHCRQSHAHKKPPRDPAPGVLIRLPPRPEPPPTIISVDTTHPGAAISPSEFGIFFEDINFGADGGLYPELVKNRSFEFSEPLTGWHEVLAIDSTGKGLAPPKARSPSTPKTRSTRPTPTISASAGCPTSLPLGCGISDLWLRD